MYPGSVCLPLAAPRVNHLAECICSFVSVVTGGYYFPYTDRKL